MAKKIIFLPKDVDNSTINMPPLPAKHFLAGWYKDGEMFIDKDTNSVASKDDRSIVGGMKSCAPFLDAMISGYMLYTWHDVEIIKNDGTVEWKYLELNEYTDKIVHVDNISVPMINERVGDIGHTIPRPAGHAQNHMVFNGSWGIKLPRGWSLLISHPLNRFDLPFTIMSGIIDSDSFTANGNIPFFLREGWTGVIPKGTPFAQLIPIQRKTWYSSIDKGLHLSWANEVGSRARQVPYGYYKKKIWVRKKYD